MSDQRENRPRSSQAGLAAPRHVIRPDHDATAKRSALEAMRAALERAGLDLEHLDEQRRQSRARLEGALDRFRAGCDARAPAMQDAVARSAEYWLEAHRVRDALAPAAGYYAVSTADLVSADDGLDLRTEHVGPWANTAEIVFSEQTTDLDHFEGQVSFAFSWPNPTGRDLLCTVTGLFGVAATAVVTADSYWWPLDPTPPASRIDVGVALGLRVVEANGQVTVPPVQDIQFQYVVDLVVNADWGEGTIVGQDISRGYVLQYENLFLPAPGKLEADLSCEISWLAGDGGGQFIAAGNGRKLSGFGLVIATQPRDAFPASPPAHA
jgi:hypothetical protein